MAAKRYVSSTYDLVLDTQPTVISMSPEFNNLVKLNHKSQLKVSEWYEILPNAVYYRGFDKLIFKEFFIIIYEDTSTKLFNSIFISKFGELHYNSVLIDKKSKYYPAIQNLTMGYQKSNVRKVLAVTCLRAFSMLTSYLKQQLNPQILELDLWDETTAGELSNQMTLIDNKKPSEIGLKFMEYGFLQTSYINSAIFDIVYSNKTQRDIDENNNLVFHIGEQLDQLFDPLTEYSPEPTEKVYQPPNVIEHNDSQLAQSICQELLQVQKNFTTNLVDFLQNYILPLRIRVLNGAIKGYTTTKLNTIFPPTIDEVTRINCIYLDALKLALPYGSFEIIKASGMTIPYFYKAYMRHEAATKSFNSNLKDFLNDLQRQKIPEDSVYTRQKIESIIHGSLNLTKIKMILTRLANCDNDWTDLQKSHIPTYLESSTVTIDSFAKDNLVPYQHRVFTPTGKMLTEIADGWPLELQYGWLTRRVVAIYDVENVLDEYKQEVFVIFSDLVLFLRVDKDNIDQGNGDIHKPSVADILMHSLINESPINNVSSLTVVGWAGIQGVHVSTYLDEGMIKVIANDINGVMSPYATKEFAKFYKLMSGKKGTKIIELINKAKILNKTQPFHLFKKCKYGLTIYSTAHDYENYSQELVKSPFAIFLKMEVDYQFLVANNIFFALTIFIHENKLLLKGYYLQYKNNFVKEVNFEDLSSSLCDIMSTVYANYFNYDINRKDCLNLLQCNAEAVELVDNYLQNKKKIVLSRPKQAPLKEKITGRSSLEIFNNSRNTSDSSVIHTDMRLNSIYHDLQSTQLHKMASRKSIESRKSLSNTLKQWSSNTQNNGGFIKKFGQVFNSKHSKNSSINSVKTHQTLTSHKRTQSRPVSIVTTNQQHQHRQSHDFVTPVTRQTTMRHIIPDTTPPRLEPPSAPIPVLSALPHEDVNEFIELENPYAAQNDTISMKNTNVDSVQKPREVPQDMPQDVTMASSNYNMDTTGKLMSSDMTHSSSHYTSKLIDTMLSPDMTQSSSRYMPIALPEIPARPLPKTALLVQPDSPAKSILTKAALASLLPPQTISPVKSILTSKSRALTQHELSIKSILTSMSFNALTPPQPPIQLVSNKPLSTDMLRTSHSVRRKLSKLATDLNFNYYEDGDDNWELLGSDSTQIFPPITREESNIAKNLPLLPTPFPKEEKSMECMQDSVVESPFLQNAPLIKRERRASLSEAVPVENRSTIIVRSSPVKEEEDVVESSFNITFDDIESLSDVERNSIHSIEATPMEESTEAKIVAPKQESTEVEMPVEESTEAEIASPEQEENFYSPIDERNVGFHWDLIPEDGGEEKIVQELGEEFDKCEPQPQQFKYKDADEYDAHQDSSIINQIQLDDTTTSDFTMSTDSQQGEEELRANLTWFSPSQLDVVIGTQDENLFQLQRQKFTSKINIVPPPVQQKPVPARVYYVPRDDTVRFDEPVLRASSYSYLLGVLGDDTAYDMPIISEEEPTKVEPKEDYSKKITENLKDSSISYLARFM